MGDAEQVGGVYVLSTVLFFEFGGRSTLLRKASGGTQEQERKLESRHFVATLQAP
jgi:hypothetical protein